MRYTVGLREANHHLAKHSKAVEKTVRSLSPAAASWSETGPVTGGDLHWTRNELYER